MVRSRSYIATPPGATIKEQLNDRGMSQKEFATRMSMSEKHISKLVNGEVQLTFDMAFRLESVLGVPAKFWINLETIYREKMFKVQQENAIEKDLVIADNFPYYEMVNLGWIKETRNEKERVELLRKYFEVVELSILDHKSIQRIAYRKLDLTEKTDLEVMTWIQEARRKARDLKVSSIDKKRLERNLNQLTDMIMSPSDESLNQVQQYLAMYGIAVVFMPNLHGFGLQGAAFLDGKKYVIALAVDDQNDQIWFNLFHELGHIMLGHVEKTDGTTESDEKAADEWAMLRLSVDSMLL